MERGKSTNKNKSKSTELGKLLATLYSINKYIPGCENIHKEYGELWNPGIQQNSATIKKVKSVIRKSLHQWLLHTDPIEVLETLQPIRRNKTLHPFFISLKGFVRRDHQKYFESDYKGLPNDFTAPCVFLVLENNGETITLKKPLALVYGQTRVEIRGTVMRAEDGQLTMGLLMLMRKKSLENSLEMSEKIISFTTTREEVAETLGKKQPGAESTREAVWAGLTRLNDCRMTLTNAKGLRTLGGILSGARELEEDSNYDIRIHLDRDFVELIDKGYTRIDPKIYFHLPPIQSNLYLFLNRQQTFNSRGVLNPISIFKVYRYAGLGGINPEDRPDWYKRKKIKEHLKELQRKGIIGEYTIVKDILTIRNKPKQKNRAVVKGEIKRNDKKAETTTTMAYDDILQLFPEKFQKDTLFQTRLQEWKDYQPELKMINWKASVREWSDHSVEEVCSQINRSISNGYKGVNFPPKKEQKCPQGKTFGVDHSHSLSRCQEYCNIEDKCLAAKRKMESDDNYEKPLADKFKHGIYKDIPEDDE